MTSKLLYANGDSFVFGMEAIEDCSKDPENKNYSFSKYLSDLLGCELYINNAYNGATNEFIFRNTIFDLLELENQGYNPKEVFVVIGWTSLHRIEVDGNGYFSQVPGFMISNQMPDGPGSNKEFKDHGTMFVNPGIGLSFIKDNKKIDTNKEVVEWCAKYFWTETVQLPRHEAMMLALQQILTAKGYRFVMLNTVCPLERTTKLNLSDRNLYKLDTDSFYQYASNNHKSKLRKWNHFSHDVHAAYAERLFEYIENANI
jgi:hypothetical protein